MLAPGQYSDFHSEIQADRVSSEGMSWPPDADVVGIRALFPMEIQHVQEVDDIIAFLPGRSKKDYPCFFKVVHDATCATD